MWDLKISHKSTLEGTSPSRGGGHVKVMSTGTLSMGPDGV